jgi:8-oxo-dGTP pyrophosphatase MutT (NUDIX family)
MSPSGRKGGKGRAGAGARGARRESSAGGVVFRIASGQPLFLLIQDSYGNWGFPKGHLERGERADTAALREVMEETGLRSVTVVAAVATIEWFFRFRGRLIHKNCQFYLMETATADTKPQRAEGITACRWSTVEEGLKLIGYENARGVLRQASELLATRSSAAAGTV